MRKNLKLIFISIILSLTSLTVWAQSYDIDYYGIVSTQIDANMSKMTSDLYFTQLSEISNFSIQDRRNGTTVHENEPDSDTFSETRLSFYALISKDEKTEKWTSVFKVVDRQRNEEHSKAKTYDSFYKILTEPKSVLQETIKNLIEKDTNSTALQKGSQMQETGSAPQKGGSIESTEVLSGTWSGESSIDKIVILRGGRGFVIFKNGASMNIGIELSATEGGQQVIITQKGKSNASFFPELSRNLALTAAMTAEPISWTLTPLDGNTLTGTKSTLIQNGDSYESGILDVEWKRVN